MRLIAVAGTRPHFVMIAPLLPQLLRAGITVDVAYTGSRAVEAPDPATDHMSFFGVQLPAPRWFLEVGSGAGGVTTGRALETLERLFAEERPDAVLVVGDANSSLAAAISAAKAGIPVVHLGAGVRCGDMTVSEEINRQLISRITAVHLTPTDRALENLEDEGIEPERIHFVGSMLAEAVIRSLDPIARLDAAANYGLQRREYVLGSFHQPVNLASPDRLAGILGGLSEVGLPVLITDTDGLRAAAERFGLTLSSHVHIVDAVGYYDFLALERDSLAVVTDSSGVQVEACMLFAPCVTVCSFTEQEATIEVGANRLCDSSHEAIGAAITGILADHASWVTPKRWDQTVSDRIARTLKRGIPPLA